ncbi:repressor of RNA polymerase III transcription MAF1 homolog [Anneissia japonica]|uniref:repressor of RNA polymerase III transcription MAF1 homolog n=1 Tax=Anneissia japonica TaxID=1529436 RepID=UPI001425ABBC|nr:repressor of RNA polymerase III transcription MAF1 homolog [Anneissia japonica]
MKLLDNSKLEAISEALTVETGDCKISGKVESYSCKMAGNDKRLFKLISSENGQSPNDLQALSPPQSGFSLSPGQMLQLSNSNSGEEASGPLCHTCSRRMIFYLIATLNASFHPDYDFSDAKSHEFSREPSSNWTVNAVDTNLYSVLGEMYTGLKSKLWSAINDEIQLNECEVYSYNTDLESDPFGEEGVLWSFNYFFYNKKLKRILFVTCRATSKSAIASGDSGIGFDLHADNDYDDLYVEDEDEYEEYNLGQRSTTAVN